MPQSFTDNTVGSGGLLKQRPRPQLHFLIVIFLTTLLCLSFYLHKAHWISNENSSDELLSQTRTNNRLSQPVRYDGHQVVRVAVRNHTDLERLLRIVERHAIDVWSPLRTGHVDLRIPPNTNPIIHELVALPYEIIITDVQVFSDQQRGLNAGSDSKTPRPAASHVRPPVVLSNEFFTQYRSFEELAALFSELADQFEGWVQRVNIGRTHEGRDIFGVRIHRLADTKSTNGEDQRVWVTPDEEDQEYGKDKIGDEKKEEEEGEKGEREEGEEGEEGEGEGEGEREAVDANKTSKETTSTFEMNRESHKGTKETTHSATGKRGRRAIKVHKGKMKKKRHEIVIVGGQHGREWISTAVATYIAYALATGYTNNRYIAELVNKFEFTIIPLINADGYEYSRTTDRLWRKNRQPTSVPYCVGTDLNQNWDYHWGYSDMQSNPCSEVYHGSEAFSAPEVRHLAHYFEERDQVAAFLDLHSYSQLWMYPYAAQCRKPPKNKENMLELAIGAVDVMSHVHGVHFQVGSACQLLYKQTGTAIDWVHNRAKVRYSYWAELRDAGTYGFLLPPDQIVPSGEETLASVIFLGRFINGDFE